MLTSLCALILGASLGRAFAAPHIVHILMDDLGWAEVGYHNQVARAAGDIKTPNLDKLVEDGLEIDRFYTEKICSPSRSSLQSGRFGIHVNVQNVFPELTNLDDPVGGYQGIPVNMTGMAEILRDRGYATKAVGKWDVGMATEYHSPKSRGYDYWFGYWHHSNDYWQFDEGTCDGVVTRDLWRINETYNAPVPEYQNGPSCAQDNQFPADEACVYEEDILFNEVVDIIKTHDSSTPLFLFYSMHLVHMPLQAKKAALDEFSFIDNRFRQEMHAMVNAMDIYIGGVVAALQESGLWEDTLLVVHGDNGGELLAELCGGNNWPLRGGKFSHFEGGIRVPAVVSGGYLPEKRRGQKEEALISIADWYATYAHLSGASDADVMDTKAASAGLPAVDSVNCWGVISGEKKSCRSEIVIGETSAIAYNLDGDALVGAIIREDYYKVLLGPSNQRYLVGQDVLTGPIFPNNTLPIVVPVLNPRVCDRTPENGCLFNVLSDPGESNNLASEMPELFYELLARMDEVQETVYSPKRGHKDSAACEVASQNGYYWGPFLEPVF